MGTVPNTFASMPTGNVPASDLDANFAALAGISGSPVTGHVALFGSSNNLTDGGAPGTIPRSYLAGYTLSNDGTTPNTVLDVGAGMATDSTNTVLITTSNTFFGSTGGSWVAGAGSSATPVNKMGVGLTIAASTWYYVFAIINGGSADVYFDTSVTAANAPAGTTAFRCIGAFQTDSSAHILPFIQSGRRFSFAQVQVLTNGTSGTAASVNTSLPSIATACFGSVQVIGTSASSNAGVLGYVGPTAALVQTYRFDLNDTLSASNITEYQSTAPFGPLNLQSSITIFYEVNVQSSGTTAKMNIWISGFEF